MPLVLKPSSGIHLARAVLESAQRSDTNLDTFSLLDASGSTHAEPPQPTSDTIVALPSRETAIDLTRLFFAHFQVQYPILIEDAFLQDISALYDGGVINQDLQSTLRKRFMLTIVISIALLCLSRENPNAVVLAESYSAQALLNLTVIMQKKTMEALQCLLLLLLYSLLSPTKAPIWYISGLCMRMCVDLGLHMERSITFCALEAKIPKPIEVDSKRRLFWVTYTFDQNLSMILGRPFTLKEENIDVEYPSITLPPDKCTQIVHWLKLRRLHSEAASRLYGTRSDSSVQGPAHAELETWLEQTTVRLGDWFNDALQLATWGNQNLDWYVMIILRLILRDLSLVCLTGSGGSIGTMTLFFS